MRNGPTVCLLQEAHYRSSSYGTLSTFSINIKTKIYFYWREKLQELSHTVNEGRDLVPSGKVSCFSFIVCVLG